MARKIATKKTEKSGLTERAGDFAKNIWLAGLGAYGEAYDEVSNQQKNIKELPQLFKDLVSKGAGIESSNHRSTKTSSGKQKSSSEKPTTSNKHSLLSGESIEQRIRRMRDNLNLNWPAPSGTEMHQLEGKIDSLSTEVKELKELLLKQLKTTKAPKKITAKKATAINTRKKTTPLSSKKTRRTK